MLPTPRVLYASFDAVPAPKGASVHILQTAAAIARVAEVDLLTLPGVLPDPPALPERVRRHTFEPSAGNFLQRALEWGDHVAQRLLAERYDVVHVRSIWEGYPALLLQQERGFRLVYEANGLPSVELRHHYPALTSQRDLIAKLRTQERALLRSAHRVMTQSRVTRGFLRTQGAPADRLHVIPNGVEPARFDPTPRQPDGAFRIAYVGTLAPWQGVPFLIESVALAAAEADVRLRIAGGGRKEWRKALERKVERLDIADRVQFLGSIPPGEVPTFLQEADACVAPLTVTDRNMTQGCCPIKILEYMAAGRAVLASRIPAVWELVAHEETALLYKPDKPRRLAEAILRLAADPHLAQRLGVAAREAAQRDFTCDRHNRAVEDVYRDLVAEV